MRFLPTRFRSRLRKARLRSSFTGDLRLVARRPLAFLKWELTDNSASWLTFDTFNKKDKAIVPVTIKGRTFWVEASRGKPSTVGLWLTAVLLAPFGIGLVLAMWLIIVTPAENKLVFHTVDPRIHGVSLGTSLTVKSHKDFKRALALPKPVTAI